MGPLSLFTDFLAESPPQVTFLPDRCLRSRLNSNRCRRCLERCPSGAVSVNNRTIHLDTAQCTGCMSCVAACPQDALVSDHDLDELLNSFHPGGDAVVSCLHRSQTHPDEIVIPCVGIFSQQMLAAIVLSGCRSVTFQMIACDGCPNRDAADRFRVNCQQVTDEFSDVHAAKMILVDLKEPLAIDKRDRRAFLKNIRDIATDISTRSLSPKRIGPVGEIHNSRRVPFKTKLVRKMHTAVEGNVQKKILGLFGYTLSVNAHCDCCPLCKGMCPTGAIQIDRDGQEKKLKFDTLDCSGCGICTEFCRKKAICLGRTTTT